MEFQVLDYHDTDYDFGESESGYPEKEYTVYLFGRTKSPNGDHDEDSKSVCAVVRGFEPLMYFLIPRELQKFGPRDLLDSMLRDKVINFWLYKQITSFTKVKRKKAYGFTNGRLYEFIEVNKFGRTLYKLCC